ncbi:MAG: putative rane protein [Pseudonocardiales bacterium]|jgi:putative membrane protein|nr:putative rane protein [Pseudonocardiales bacterium]
MTSVVWIFALLGAVLHVVVFVWEAVLFQRPGVHQGIFFVRTADVPAVRLWAFGVGFYNLFLASGVVAGVIAWGVGDVAVGRALVIYTCLFMFLSGLVLLVADRLELGRARGKGLGGALAQSVPPLVALIAVVL